MLTARGWWVLFFAVLMLLVGILRGLTGLTVTGLAFLLWLGWEWLTFTARIKTLARRLSLQREVLDDRGPVATLWVGREFRVRVALRLGGAGKVPFVAIADPVPFDLEHVEGRTHTDGALASRQPMLLDYTVRCSVAGVARFEGVRVETADLQGLFAFTLFVRDPVAYRVLPVAMPYRSHGAMFKELNLLPPPGIHRLRKPGSGSELLDLRDYQPGDPPRTIAWKVSARRDRLITKEFESEVPVRCTLFVDVSSSVRAPAPLPGAKRVMRRPLDRLVDLAAALIRANATIRDMTGLCLFDEEGVVSLARPDRRSAHRNRLAQMLADACTRGPAEARIDPYALLPVAYALAEEVYPELLRPAVNRLPAWITWFVGFPAYTRRWRGFLEWLHRRKRWLLFLGTTWIPLGLLLVNFLGLLVEGVPDDMRGWFAVASLLTVPVVVNVVWLLFLFSLLASGRWRRFARWRKRLAALLSVRHGLGPGGVEALMEDDDLLSLDLQRFLSEHQVPYTIPLYDASGRYVFARPEKLRVLARALTWAAGHGRDNELFVLMADLLELEGQLQPLLEAVRVAVARHHHVVVVVPWPAGLALPAQTDPTRVPRKDTLQGVMTALTTARFHDAYARLRRTFARLGVPVVCAEAQESARLILERIERLRGGLVGPPAVGGRP
jgi:uncharacterized protein (DUF58 family)